jgi:hypothetical protein
MARWGIPPSLYVPYCKDLWSYIVTMNNLIYSKE